MRAEELRTIGELMVRVPSGFSIHPKVKKLLDQRVQMTQGRHAIDFGTAELLAYGSLLRQGTPVRLTGQDSRRGTFNQRHATLIDTETEAAYTPLANMAFPQPLFEVYDSPLSEAAVLGFEYGYSRDYPETLVLWEAQFGDFANGAQVYDRSVHHRGRRQVGIALRAGYAAAARLRGAGAGALQRAHGTLPTACGA